jgi:phosphoribosylamine--glycine ligase
MASLGRTWPVAAGDQEGLEDLVRERRFDLVVIGPEDPLAAGLADRLRARGSVVFGPGARGARLEGSKAFAKDFMVRHGIPTARYHVVDSVEAGREVLREWGLPVVVKASGLAAGKGVTVAVTREEAEAALRSCLEENRLGAAGSRVVVEECLEGEEASVFVVTDGRRFRVLPGSQDHKRAFDGDRGPNTGGMGAVSPTPVLSPRLLERVEREMILPTLAGLEAEGIEFRGVLYLGIMVTRDGPRLLEYNVRFGDPETQVVLPRLGYDLAALLLEAARGELGPDPGSIPAHEAAACVVAAAADYPARGAKGLPISGLQDAEREGALVFHAGTAREGDRIVTAGGRILNLVGLGRTTAEALERAYAGIAAVSFSGMRYRKDIGRGSS